jgi:hypothetical protein
VGIIKNQLQVQDHITVPTGAAQSIADLLGMDLSNTEQAKLLRRVSNVLFMAHPSNGANIYLGASDVASNKCIPLGPDRIVELNADDTDADEDISYLDLNEIFVLAGTGGQILILAEIKSVDSSY